MKVGKKQGIAVLVFGLILLTAGILVLIAVPSWGEWIASYPAKMTSMSLPPQAAPIAQGMGGIFSPLFKQVGGYIKTVGYFIGSLLTIVSIGVTTAGAMVVKSAGS